MKLDFVAEKVVPDIVGLIVPPLLTMCTLARRSTGY